LSVSDPAGRALDVVTTIVAEQGSRLEAGCRRSTEAEEGRRMRPGSLIGTPTDITMTAPVTVFPASPSGEGRVNEDADSGFSGAQIRIRQPVASWPNLA
jgi:hypothetical protein